jgi:hypothetical protein
MNQLNQQFGSEKLMQIETVERLVGIPPLIGFESPASWLTRAALSQGVSPWLLLKHLNLHPRADLDLALREKLAEKIVTVCQLDPNSFQFATKIYRNLKKIDPDGRNFLLDSDSPVSYRYCPVCMHRSRVKHFMVHWRFLAWVYCPLHQCMMEDSCRSCGAAVSLPNELLKAGPDGKGIAYLDLCSLCGFKLSSHWESALGTVDQRSVTPWQWSQMMNGRALLSALYHGEVRYHSDPGRLHGVKDLLKIQRRMLLPSQHFSIKVTMEQ